mmetsp:Transcript_15515/g.31981  ORF Transcript_15515/g.31981 Transcript_15515/m.31981 type:complete len:246 (+) Transcript_15515:152-889(+)
MLLAMLSLPTSSMSSFVVFSSMLSSSGMNLVCVPSPIFLLMISPSATILSFVSTFLIMCISATPSSLSFLCFSKNSLYSSSHAPVSSPVSSPSFSPFPSPSSSFPTLPLNLKPPGLFVMSVSLTLAQNAPSKLSMLSSSFSWRQNASFHSGFFRNRGLRRTLSSFNVVLSFTLQASNSSAVLNKPAFLTWSRSGNMTSPLLSAQRQRICIALRLWALVIEVTVGSSAPLPAPFATFTSHTKRTRH